MSLNNVWGLSRDLWVPWTLLRDSPYKNDQCSSLLPVWFCGFDPLSFATGISFKAPLCMCLLLLDYSFSLLFQFLWCLFHPYMYHSPLCSKSLPLCFAFSPSGDAVSADHLMLTGWGFLAHTRAVLQSCCSPADQHSQLGYLNAALLVLCWIC